MIDNNEYYIQKLNEFDRIIKELEEIIYCFDEEKEILICEEKLYELMFWFHFYFDKRIER